MGGRGEPPDGTPEGAPSGAEDEYRSVVFDESFVRAARLQEYSAQERMTDHTPAVRRRPSPHTGLSRQALALLLLIALAFATAIFMGVRTPYRSPLTERPAEALRTTVVPLAPRGEVPGAADPGELYAHSQAAGFEAGAEGIPWPAHRATAHFSDSQVVAALTYARDYIVASSLDPAVLTGGAVDAVRSLLDPGQLDQFDQSIEHPAADGRHAPTGWLVRFDPARVRLADPRIRMRGSLQTAETDADTLEVTADPTAVYALRPAVAAAGARASLFTVRRELRFRFDREDLRLHQVQLVTSTVQAGPLSCSEDSTARFGPLLAGQHAKAGGPAGTDPYAPDGAPALCGTLAPSAQPRL
ncbi:SCO2583 family membrane protein [Streptomyces seoulensis]